MVYRDCSCYAARGGARCYGPLLNKRRRGIELAEPSSFQSSPWCLVFEKFKSARRDPATVGGVVAIVFAVLVIVGIAYFYNNRPSALTEAAQNVRQIFHDTFR
jgi:hypothetical protein